MRHLERPALALAVPLLAALSAAPAGAQTCPEEPVFRNFTFGTQQAACPCFAVGEEAGAIFDVPAAHYPIEILRVQITWGSFLGGAQQTLEQAVHIYPAGLPNPGVPQFSLPGPVMTDGSINEFDIEPIPGNKIINSGPFTVTLEFATANANMIFSPSMVSDGDGCQTGRNVVFAIPGGWNDACSLGVSGDWEVGIVYRQTNCGGGGAPVFYCTGKTTSQGCVPFISAAGTPSTTSTGSFTITMNDAVPNESGFLFYGSGKANLNFHGGKLCVKSPFERTSIKAPKNPGTGCSGWRLQRDFNQTVQSGNDPSLTVGRVVTAQWRQRDPTNPLGFGDALSDAVRFVIQ